MPTVNHPNVHGGPGLARVTWLTMHTAVEMAYFANIALITKIRDSMN